MQDRDYLLSVFVGSFFKHYLVKTETNVVKPQRSYVLNVSFGDIALEMLHISYRDDHSSFGRQYVKALVVGEPAADAGDGFDDSYRWYSSNK